MGLIYDSADSSAVKSALTANLTAADSVLDAAQSASNRLIAALGAGELSGKGYSAVDALFAQVIAPCITGAKSELGTIRGELEKYTAADAAVSQYGVLKEDELNKQLTATKKQRDATERQMETNSEAAVAATAVPGLAESLHATNDRLELVLIELENAIRDLETRLQALHNFVSATAGLFASSLAKVAAATGDTMALLKQLNDTKIGLTYTGVLKAGVGTFAARQAILDVLAGRKLTVDAYGRVKLGGDPLYKPRTNRLWDKGREFSKEAKTKIDNYRHPIKAGVRAAVASPIKDYTGWKGASPLGRVGKGLGVAGTFVSVGANAHHYFNDGVDEHDWPDFGVDTGVDIATAAVGAGAGAAVGSLFLPPVGTVVGALVGFFVGWSLSSPAEAAKDAIKNAYR